MVIFFLAVPRSWIAHHHIVATDGVRQKGFLRPCLEPMFDIHAMLLRT